MFRVTKLIPLIASYFLKLSFRNKLTIILYVFTYSILPNKYVSSKQWLFNCRAHIKLWMSYVKECKNTSWWQKFMSWFLQNNLCLLANLVICLKMTGIILMTSQFGIGYKQVGKHENKIVCLHKIKWSIT